MLNFLRRLPLISASNYLLVHQKLVPQVPQTIASDTLVLDVVPQGPQTSASSAPDECLKCPRRVPQVPQVPQTSAPNECPKCPKRVPQVPQKSAPSAPVPQIITFRICSTDLGQYENIFLPEFRFRPLKSCMAFFKSWTWFFDNFYILVHI